MARRLDALMGSYVGRPLVAIVGPTAVGKSALALSIARATDGEIVNLDTRQMVRGLDIGTAKPSHKERRDVPHHLVDITSCHEPLSLASVQSLAYEAIDGVHGRGRLPLLVGGSGQYMRAVLQGWTVPEVAPDPDLRHRLATVAAERGPSALHARLAAVDPLAASRIDPRNVRRVIRALEVHEKTGRRISELQSRVPPPYRQLAVGLTLSRHELYARIDRRIDAMLHAGLEWEVRGLVAAGCDFESPAMSSVGYREWRGLLAGTAGREECIGLIRRNTRRLARQQATWFRRDDPRIEWFDPVQVAAGEAVTRVQAFAASGST